MPLFTTKDLTVTSAMIAVDHENSEKRFFIDNKDGKGISVSLSLDEAIGFAKAYQKLLG